jgi:hypothetical protein
MRSIRATKEVLARSDLNVDDDAQTFRHDPANAQHGQEATVELQWFPQSLPT